MKGVVLAAGFLICLELLLDLHAAAGLPGRQHTLTLFVDSICLVKVSADSVVQRLRPRLLKAD